MRKEELSHKGVIHLSISWTLKLDLIEEAFSGINLVAKGILGLFSRQVLAKLEQGEYVSLGRIKHSLTLMRLTLHFGP